MFLDFLLVSGVESYYESGPVLRGCVYAGHVRRSSWVDFCGRPHVQDLEVLLRDEDAGVVVGHGKRESGAGQDQEGLEDDGGGEHLDYCDGDVGGTGKAGV